MAYRGKRDMFHGLPFRVFVTLALFIPPVVERGYDPSRAAELTAAVLTRPLIGAWIPFVLFPLLKLALLAAVLLPLVKPRVFSRLPFAYYAPVLVLLAFSQNMAFTEGNGFVWLVGNTVAELAVALLILADLRTAPSAIDPSRPRTAMLWVVPLMLLAFLMPYSLAGGAVAPSFGLSVLTNEAGATYCMVTPVILGLMLLFPNGVRRPTLSAVSYVGLLFGLLNAATWFFLKPESAWMGVLHLPLLLLSAAGLAVSRNKA